jgi:hypothetical protein
MKEEQVFSVAEFYGDQLEEFQNFTDAKEGYEISRKYIDLIESEFKAMDTHYETLESMLPNGDFTITIKTFYGTYEFEGFNRTNLIH